MAARMPLGQHLICLVPNHGAILAFDPSMATSMLAACQFDKPFFSL